MSRPLVALIVSDQPVLAALVALLVELAGHRPEFVRPGERLELSLQRSPLARLVLVDEQHPAARSDLFLARAARRGVAVVLFGAPTRRAPLQAAARALGARSVVVPLPAAELAGVLERAATARSPGDRRSPDVQRRSDGTLVYLDREGARWFVYDRRAGLERRRADRDERLRLFVNEAGEMWRYRLRVEDADDPRAGDLERQLARAELVKVVN